MAVVSSSPAKEADARSTNHVVPTMNGSTDASSTTPESKTPENKTSENKTSESKTSESKTSESTPPVTENPFDSAESRVLFEAIDQLQSCQINQHIEIPQLVIVGGQSSGKSSLVQSLTDIPLPVGAGCCTRFATWIVSKRTGSNSANQFKVTIVDSEVGVSGFGYGKDDDEPSYKAFERVGETLSPDEFVEIVEEVSSKYMGIKPGTGPGKKNFATQVLRIELSGPSRSHFSILDIPGHVSNAVTINKSEIAGVTDMIVHYMKQKENIVICVADAVVDLQRHDVVNLASQHVGTDRLVKVFTKCDMVPDTDETVKHATSYLGGSWFVVRNRRGEEDMFFDLSGAEDQLFGQSSWAAIPEDRRGTAKLRLYLSHFLSRRIRCTFPLMREQIRGLLEKARTNRLMIGDPRLTVKDHHRFLREIIRRYELLANQSLRSPWLLDDDKMRVRGKVTFHNEEFSRKMNSEGHTHPFEDVELEFSPETRHHQSPFKPATTDPSSSPASQRGQAFATGARRQSATALFNEIQSQLHLFQSTQLPGLVNPEIVPVLFRKQTEKWQTLAQDHLDLVARTVADASLKILISVCPYSENKNEALYSQLFEALRTQFESALAKAQDDLKSYCEKQRHHQLQTTDVRFYAKLKAMQTARWQWALAALRTKHGGDVQMDNAVAFHEHFHFSAENNITNEIHDILKVYYEITVESFIRHVSTTIVEDFVSNPTGSLLGLSQGWVDSLSDAEVRRLAAEDTETIRHREYLDNHIEKLQAADKIAEAAWTLTAG